MPFCGRGWVCPCVVQGNRSGGRIEEQSQAEHTSTPFPELFVRVVFQQEGDTEHTRRNVFWVQECARDSGFQWGVSARGADAHKALELLLLTVGPS